MCYQKTYFKIKHFHQGTFSKNMILTKNKVSLIQIRSICIESKAPIEKEKNKHKNLKLPSLKGFDWV
jgi:hypothetical protein